MLTKTIKIDGKNVTFGASASVVRLYRLYYNRDILKDFAELKRSLDEANINAGADGSTTASALPVETLTIFENLAYVMARIVNPNIPGTPEEWLDGFSMFSFYSIAPDLVNLWVTSAKTLSNPKKK